MIKVETESRGIRKNFPIFIIEREDIKPILAKDWLRGFRWTVRHTEEATTITDQSAKDKIITKFETQSDQ